MQAGFCLREPMFWRLKLDSPYTFCTEYGFYQAVNCRDFAVLPRPDTKVFVEQATNILMLRPSFETRIYNNNLVPLTDFNYVTPWWRETKRSTDQARGMANLVAFGATPTNIALPSITDAIIILDENLGLTDTLRWALQTRFMLAADESFAIHYHGVTDEMVRKTNWFAVAWDNIFLHFSHTGLCRVYEYDRGNKALTPVFKHAFHFSKPSQTLGRHGMIWFLPIPGVGLVVQHMFQQKHVNLVQRRGGQPFYMTNDAAVIPWPSQELPDGTLSMFNSSSVLLAVNPYSKHELHMERVTFDATGTFLDKICETPERRTAQPSVLAPFVLRTWAGGAANCTMTIRKADDSLDWLPAHGRQWRAKLALNNGFTPQYTPFVVGYGLTWAPVYATRNTVELTVAKLQELDFIWDEKLRFEGNATCLLESTAEKLIAERGDATFTLEVSTNGTSWGKYAAGECSLKPTPVIDDKGFHYLTQISLKDWFHRFKDVTIHLLTSLEDNTIKDGLNTVLLANGFSPIVGSIPTEIATLKLPSWQVLSHFRFAPREGDSSDKLLEFLLTMARMQQMEILLRHNFATGEWYLEKKTRLTDESFTWHAVPFTQAGNRRDTGVSHAGLGARYVTYGEGTSMDELEKPECNLLKVEGLTKPEGGGERFVAAIENSDSLTNPASPDYMGRPKYVRIPCDALFSQPQVNKMARRLEPILMHQRIRGKIVFPFNAGNIGKNIFGPNVQLKFHRGDGSIYATLWVKKTHVVVTPDKTYGFAEVSTLHVDSVWESDIS